MTTNFKIGDKVTYQKNKRERGNATIKLICTSPKKKNHWYISTETEGTLLVSEEELEAR